MRLITLAAILSLAAPASYAANYEDFASSFDTSAFDSFDSDTLRMISNRHTECGRYGDSNKTRAEVLISRYQALAKAIKDGDQDLAEDKAASFVRAAEANSRFEKCWNELRRRAGVSSSFVKDAKSLS